MQLKSNKLLFNTNPKIKRFRNIEQYTNKLYYNDILKYFDKNVLVFTIK
jgi:hypothetical protein